MKREKVKTGVSCFDKLCDGGLNEHSMNLVVGGAGAGKTIFSMQFIMTGLKNGETCVYITFEEKKEELYKNMLCFGWDLQKYEDKEKFIFMEYSPEKVKNMLDEGGGTLDAIMRAKKVSRLVIDSITSFALLFENELRKKKASLELFDILKRWNTTCVLTLQRGLEEKDLIATTNSGPLEFEVDTIILLYLLRSKKKRKRYIEILKMRGSKHSEAVYPIDIKDGIHINQKEVKI
jgi:circadian clock protein KaiC